MPAAAGANDTFTVDPTFTGAYSAALEVEEKRAQATGAYSGGGCGCSKLGGAAGESLDLAEASQYVDSINSKSKTRIIESILEAAAKLGLKSEGSTPAARIKSLLAAIPAGDRFKRDDKAQAQVCESIAKAINAAYGVKVMDAGLPADALCQHIAEILSSLGAGVHTEFLAVYNDVQKVLHNLSILQEQLTADMNQMKEKMSQSEDQIVVKNLQLNFDLYEMLVGEIKRQVQLLSNLLNVHLVPSAGDLAKLLKDKKELHGWVKKIDLKPGSDKFGRVISDLLRGLGVTANFMLVVEQALSTVGLTLSQYKEMKNLDQLRAAAVSKGLSLSGDELHKFNDALELLEKNLSKVKYTPVIGSYSQDAEMFGSGLTAGDMGDSRRGSCGEEPKATGAYSGGDTYARSTMDKRVEDRKKLRNLIYQTFVRQLHGVLDKFVGALDVLSMKIGTEIPISDQLDGFRQAINRISLELARKKQVYLALIGYYNDAMSKSKRDQVVGEMKMVSSFIDSIVELPMYRASAGHFQAVQSQIKSLLELIGKYSEEISAKFGRGETADEVKERNGAAASAIGAIPVGGAASMVGEVHGSYGAASAIGLTTGVIGRGASAVDIDGGASAILAMDPNYGGKGEDAEGAEDDEERSGGYAGGIAEDVPAPKFRATKTLDDAVRQFDYKFRVAQIRGNLTRAGSELSHYGEKYEKITANSLAEVLRSEQKKYAVLTKSLEADLKTAGNNQVVVDELKEAKKFLDGQWEAKKKFWATVEALDGYMRAFTNGIVNHPNDIKDIRAVLDDIEVIRDWYSELSGNQLASVFDHFPSAVGTVQAPSQLPTEDYLKQDGDSHYYQSVEKGMSAGSNPGNPYNVTTPKKAVDARTTLKGMLSSMTALKNLLSVFVHFGSKFGGNDLNKVTFLTPAQIYNNLLDYLQASAFQQGFRITDLTAGNADGSINSASWNATGVADALDRLVAVHGANVGVSTADLTLANTTGGNTNAELAKAVRTRHWGVWMRSVNSIVKPLHGGSEGFTFDKEDDYFVILMKAIGAKILTVTGMYDVLDRPHEFNGISPIRMIMGGDDTTPKVEEGAVALYLRLPLLCQFWRTIFNFNEPSDQSGENVFAPYTRLPMNDTMLKISMVPDVDGIFSGLIRLVFRKQKYLDTSAYSDDDIKEIIRECNMIYQKMLAKHPQNTVMETIYELIAEVNRRYGVVSKDDRDKFETEFGNRYDYGTGNTLNPDGTYTDRYSRDPDPADIALLPGEDEEAIPRPSAAERLLEGTDFNQSSTRKSKYNVDLQHRDLLYRFRCVIDKFFENPSEEYSFNGAIKSTQQKLKRETRDEERFKIVASLVRGVDVYSKVDGLKYLLFHETVVAGLNVLSGLHSMLSRFQARAQLMNLSWLVSNVIEYMKGQGVAPAGPNGAPVAAGVGAFTEDHLAQYLADAYTKTRSGLSYAEARALLDSILGEAEADTCNSGRNGAQWSIRPTSDMQGLDVLRFNGQQITAGLITGPNDLAGVLVGMNPDTLKNHFYKRENDVDQNKVLCFFRYLLNREFVMKDLLESLFGLSSDLQGLVEVRIDDGKLFMNAGGLKGLINELFEQVGYFVELMRPHVRGDVMQKYTSKLHAGSLYWLQEQLLEKIIVGRAAQLAGGNAPEYANLDDQMRGLSDMYQFLTREFKFSAVLAHGAAPVINSTASRNSFDKVFASLIFYDGERLGSGLLPSKEAPSWQNTTANSPPELVKFNTDPYEALHLAGPPGAQVLDTRFAARFYQLYSWKDDLTMNRSALFVFNQLVAKFVQSFYDPGQKKMYKGLIDQFANGTFNRAINDHRFTYPDVAPAVMSKFSGPEDLKVPKQFLLTNAAIAALANGSGLRTIIENYLGALPANTPIDPTFGLGPAAGRPVTAANNGVAELAAMEAVLGNTLIPSVIASFPYSANMGDTTISAREKTSRIKMFCDMLWAVWASEPAGGFANNATLANSVTTIRNNLSSGSVYSTGRASELSYLAKGDDLVGLSSANLRAATIAPAYEEKHILLARKAAVNGAIGSDSTAKLGIPAPGADPKVSPADDDLNITAFGRRADPDADHVLFTSLAVVIRNLVHTRNSNQQQTLVYMNENAADVPIYMKEKMRANLPAFKNLFRELINRCEFLKKFMMRREMNLDRHWVANGAAGGALGMPTHNPWPWVLVTPVAGESERAKDRFAGILDTIVRGSQTLITACDTALKEIGDDPKYLELYSGSIRDYRAQYGVDPLQPVSSLLATLRNVTEATELDFFPIHSMGELHFKLMYGSRSLLQNMSAQPTAESVPGWTQTVESFNLMVDSRLQADRGHTDGMLKALAKGIRYLYDLKRVKGLLTPHITLGCAGDVWSADHNDVFNAGSFVRENLVDTPDGQITGKAVMSIVSADDAHRHLKPVFALRNELTRTVMLTESSNRDDQLKNLVEYICGEDKKDRSNNLAVQNIIDLNVIPINVHALMRDIPLANLYNYAYTYDRAMVDMYYGLPSDGAKELIRDLCGNNGQGSIINKVNSPKDMLVAMMLDPYLEVFTDGGFNNIDSRRRAEYVQGMLLGSAAEEGLGRPKFLSDQIYGKAVFGELYTSWAEVSDMGPAARYPRTLLRTGVRDNMAGAIRAIVNVATAAAAGGGANPNNGKFVRQSAGLSQVQSEELASMFMDDQTASIEDLERKINNMNNAVAANAVAVAADQPAANKAYRYALAIITKTIGAAYLWATDARLKGSVDQAAAAAAVHQIVDSLAYLKWNAGRLDVSGMKSAPVNQNSRKAFTHIVKSLEDAVISNNPLARNAAAADVAAATAQMRGAPAADLDGRLNGAYVNNTARRDQLAAPPATASMYNSRQTLNADVRGLHYLQNGDLKTASVGAGKDVLARNGQCRFDTVIVRNLIFVVNLYRSVRLRLQRDLIYSKDIIAKSIPITREQLTEFSGNSSLSRRQPARETRYE